MIDRQLIHTIASDMKLLVGEDRLKPLDSLTLIELVAALEEATGLDLLGLPLEPGHFSSIESIAALLARARSS